MEKKIIAVLTEISRTEPEFGNIHAFCEELNQLVTEAGGLFYVFSLKDFSKKAIRGFYFNGECWVKTELPLPGFVYNRIHSRRTENGKKFAQFLQAAEELNIKVFNQRFLSKWEVHQWLSKRQNLKRYLPETSLFSESAFSLLTNQFDELYLKPLTGSQGRGIIWIKDHLDMVVSTNEGMQQHQFQNINDLYQELTAKINRRPYLIQQGIPLLHQEGKRLDFRVLCHQTPEHEWSVTSIVARLSAENQFASNLALGGEMLRPLRALHFFFGKEAAQTKLELIKELALETASCISENVPGLMVELGIDIGVDLAGDFWLIEVNSKPSKNSEEKKRTIRPSAKAIVAYCLPEIEDASEGER